MKTTEELHTYYNQTMKQELEALEEERQSVKKKLIPYYIGGVLGVLGGIALLLVYIQLYYIGILVIFAVVSIVAGILSKKIKDYTVNFKGKIISKIVDFADEDLTYYPTGYISREEYMGCGIFRNRPDRYRGEDLIQGKVGKTDIRLSELHTEDKRQSGKNQTHYVTLFKGIFFIADFHKNFNGVTFVLSDVAEKTFGSWLGNAFQSWNKGRGELVKLENPDFEKEFVVYSTDQIEARYILTLTMMERILNFKRRTGQKLEMSFINNKVHMAISFKDNLFNVNINQPITDFNLIKQYYEELMFTIGIVDELNLNTRIWDKE